MVGADPKNHVNDVARRSALPEAMRFGALNLGRRWRLVLAACVFVPVSLLLVQCGRAPNPGALAANASATSNVSTASAGDTFDERFPKPEFRDRFPAPSEMLLQRQMADFAPAPKRVQTQSYRVASLEPTVPYKRQPEPTADE